MDLKNQLVTYGMVIAFIAGVVVMWIRYAQQDMWFGLGSGIMLTICYIVMIASIQFGLNNNPNLRGKK